MALLRCILGVVVLLSVFLCSVSADPGLGHVSEEKSEKLEGRSSDKNQDLDPFLNQHYPDGDWNQNDTDVPENWDSDDENSYDEGSDDEDSYDEDSHDEDSDEKSSDEENNVSTEEDAVSDQEDNLSVAERLELVNKDLVGDPDNVLEDGDVAVPRPRHRQKRNAARCTHRPWWMFWRRKCAWPRSRKNRKVYVPYVITRQFSAAQIRTIKLAFRTFAQKTCIRFVRNYKRRILWWRRWRYRNYLYIHSARGCWSFIGRRGGQQKLSLQSNGCVHLGIIQHELLHALGFHHEHRRSDRDRYVRVLWGNIIRGKAHNFKKTRTRNLGTPYDYGSVMHYRKTAFSKNGKPTLVARRRNVTFGTARSMSAWDIRRVNRLYCR